MRKRIWNFSEEGCIEEKIQAFLGFLRFTNDGTMDVERFLSTEYGEELGKRLFKRCRLEDDPEAQEQYYKSLGLIYEFHRPEDYFGRWKAFIPADYNAHASLPVMIWNHGGDNSIESEEYMTGYPELAPKEHFLLIMAQNTNAEQTLRILEDVRGRYPVDDTRIYMGGFSQGSLQVYGTALRHSSRVAAIAVTGIDPFRPWDAQDVPYTEEELMAAQKACVPVSIQVGACEPFAYAPLNRWRPHRFNPQPDGNCGSPDSFVHPGKIREQDPTRIRVPGRGRVDPNHPDAPRMPSQYTPEKGEAPGSFMVKKTNRLLALLDCEPRNAEICSGFDGLQADDLHRITGIYGDTEQTFFFGGVRHDMVGIRNRNGAEVFRYTVVENSPHWPAVTAAQLGWDFLKKFRKNRETGALEIISEEGYLTRVCGTR